MMRVLRSRILRGVYEARLPGERALAAELGTSTVTLRLALAQLEALALVRREHRRGTFIVPPAERAGGGQSTSVRLILPLPFANRSDQFWVSVSAHGFHQAADLHHVRVSLEYADEMDPVIAKAVSEASSPICVGMCALALPLERGHLVRLAGAATPVVVAEWYPEEVAVPSVNFDETATGNLAAEHLLRLGHRRIALLYHDRGTPNQRERLGAVEECLRRFGLSPSVKRQIRDAGLGEELRSVLADPANPTAAICSSVEIGEALLEMAGMMGRAVPQQLSIVSITGTKADANEIVTAVVRDHALLGRRAFEVLLDEELMAEPRRILIPVELSEMGTTAPPPPEET